MQLRARWAEREGMSLVLGAPLAPPPLPTPNKMLPAGRAWGCWLLTELLLFGPC